MDKNKELEQAPEETNEEGGIKTDTDSSGSDSASEVTKPGAGQVTLS